MKKVLLTGASRGIGKAIYEELKNDFNIITPSKDELNLSSIESINNYFKDIPHEFDILINNAGINIIKNIDSILDSDIEEITTVNLIAPLKLIKEVSKNMKKNRFGIV